VEAVLSGACRPADARVPAKTPGHAGASYSTALGGNELAVDEAYETAY